MPDMTLTARSAFGGYDKTTGGIRLAEVSDLAIVSLAVPQGDEAAAAQALTKAYGVATPAVGRYQTSADGTLRVMSTAPDQVLVLFAHDAPDARAVVQKATGAAFYSTDQTDVWCCLEISGTGVREVLARICPLDLHPDVFAPDAAERTAMEHMGAMIMRVGDDAFWVMSARSSARSFLHAVETSIDYVL